MSGVLDARPPLTLKVGTCGAKILCRVCAILALMALPRALFAVSHHVSLAFKSPISQSLPVPLVITLFSQLVVASPDTLGETYATVIQ